MVYKYTTSQVILGRVKRLFTSTDWTSMATLYIADAIQEIGLNYSTIYKTTKGNDLDKCDSCLVEVDNHLAEIPSDLEILVKIEYNGYRLPISKDKSIYGLNECDDYIWNKGFTSCIDYYTIEPNKIRTTFESGKIKIFYKAFECDNDGFIMIPDIIEFKNALTWKVMSALLLEGYSPKNKSLTFDYADNKADGLISKARNRMKQLTRDERDSLSDMLTSTNSNTQTPKIF
jgi:hypothetical protein